MESRILPAVMAVLVLALSTSLLLAKRESARLHVELRGTTRAFVQGLDLPAVPVQSPAGATKLRDYCSNKGPAVFFFSTITCAFCKKQRPRWEEVAQARGKHVSFVEVHLDGLPAADLGGAVGVTSVAALPPDVRRHLRVMTVPAVVVADSSCRIFAAGAGLSAAWSALDAVRAE
jgi:thiol-disulfide isomerase/thioredoxin